MDSHVGQRPRQHSCLAELLCQLERMTRESFGGGNVARLMDTPGKAAFGLDLQPQVVARLGEGRLEELCADVIALPEGVDPREPVERTGTVAPGRGGGTISSSNVRARSVSPASK